MAMASTCSKENSDWWGRVLDLHLFIMSENWGKNHLNSATASFLSSVLIFLNQSL
jgi:hypothetical protein